MSKNKKKNKKKNLDVNNKKASKKKCQYKSNDGKEVIIGLLVILTCSAIGLFAYGLKDKFEKPMIDKSSENILTEINPEQEQEQEQEQKENITTANVKLDEIKDYLKKNNLLVSKNITDKDIKDTNFLKENKIDKLVNEGFILESPTNEDIEKIIVLSTEKDDDRQIVYELLSAGYYLDTIEKGNRTHKKSEQSDKNIENMVLGQKGKYTYIIISPKEKEISSHLSNLLKF